MTTVMSSKQQNLPHQNLSLRSDELQDIMEKIPRWMVRWGILVIFSLLLLVLWGSYLLKYPDVVTVPLRLNSYDAPRLVSSRVEGKLEKILIRNGQYVAQGQVLAYVESTANPVQVQNLKKWLLELENAIESNKSEVVDVLFDRSRMIDQNLGELQSDYQNFDQACIRYQSYKEKGYYSQRQLLLKEDLKNLSKQQNVLKSQRSLYEQDAEIAQQELNAQQQLFNQKVISLLDFKQHQSRFLNRQLPVRQINANLIGLQKEKTAKIGELIEIQHQADQQNGLFLQAVKSLHSSVMSWENKYIIKAPVAGVTSFVSFIQEKQLLSINQELFYIMPKASGGYCEVKINQYNSGKVKLGQLAIIKFESFPFSEFGVIYGKVDYISNISSRDGSFLARIVLPRGMITNYNRRINFRIGMKATAEIITADTRLLDKLFYNFKKSISR